MVIDEAFGQAPARRSRPGPGAAEAITSRVALLEQVAWLPQRPTRAAGPFPDIRSR